MRIYSDYGLFIEHMKHNFCGFFSDSRELDEFFFSFWDFSFFFYQKLWSLKDVFRFAFVEPDRFDCLLKSDMPKRKYIFWLFNRLKEAGCDFIDLLIGRLRRENHRNEQLKRRFVVEFGFRIREKLL